MISARRFKAGRTLEDIFDSIGQTPEGQAAPGQPQEDTAKMAEAAQKAAADQAKAQTDAAIAAEKIKLEREKMEADVALKRMEIEIKAAESATRSAA